MGNVTQIGKKKQNKNEDYLHADHAALVPVRLVISEASSHLPPGKNILTQVAGGMDSLGG